MILECDVASMASVTRQTLVKDLVSFYGDERAKRQLPQSDGAVQTLAPAGAGIAESGPGAMTEFLSKVPGLFIGVHVDGETLESNAQIFRGASERPPAGTALDVAIFALGRERRILNTVDGSDFVDRFVDGLRIVDTLARCVAYCYEFHLRRLPDGWRPLGGRSKLSKIHGSQWSPASGELWTDEIGIKFLFGTLSGEECLRIASASTGFRTPQELAAIEGVTWWNSWEPLWSGRVFQPRQLGLSHDDSLLLQWACSVTSTPCVEAILDDAGCELHSPATGANWRLDSLAYSLCRPYNECKGLKCSRVAARQLQGPQKDPVLRCKDHRDFDLIKLLVEHPRYTKHILRGSCFGDIVGGFCDGLETDGSTMRIHPFDGNYLHMSSLLRRYTLLTILESGKLCAVSPTKSGIPFLHLLTLGATKCAYSSDAAFWAAVLDMKRVVVNQCTSGVAASGEIPRFLGGTAFHWFVSSVSDAWEDQQLHRLELWGRARNVFNFSDRMRECLAAFLDCQRVDLGIRWEYIEGLGPMSPAEILIYRSQMKLSGDFSDVRLSKMWTINHEAITTYDIKRMPIGFSKSSLGADDFVTQAKLFISLVRFLRGHPRYAAANDDVHSVAGGLADVQKRIWRMQFADVFDIRPRQCLV